MITLILVDLDNVVGKAKRMPDPTSIVTKVRAALPQGKRDPRGREAAVVVIAANEATITNTRNVTWSALHELASQLALAIEARLGRRAPVRVEVEPVLMPRQPEAADGALVRALARAPSVCSAGRVTDVFLLARDHILERQVTASLPGFAHWTVPGLSWWHSAPSRPRQREAPRAASGPAAEPTSAPTRVVRSAAHAAWAKGVPAQLDPCDLKGAAIAIAGEPWLRTQLSTTAQSFTGPARLRALLEGRAASLDVGAGEVVDVQGSPVRLGRIERIEEVGPGTLRARWGERGAQVLRTNLPAALVLDASRLRLVGRKPGTIDDRALRDAREGEVLHDPSWTVAFLKRSDSFHCEVERREAWPPIWWHRDRCGHGMTAKTTGRGISTPRPIRGVPVRLAVDGGKLRVRSVVDAAEVTLTRRGRAGELIAAEGAPGRCVALCASTTEAGVAVPCRPVHQVELSLLASHLRVSADWLAREGVPELPVVVVGVRDPRRSRLVRERR